MTPPRVLTIAGSDPSGGAGLQADLKTFHALGCYGMAVVTALTAQNTVAVRGVHVPPADFVQRQLAAVVEDCPPVVTKTGMLASASVVEIVVRWAERGDLGRLVVDPVMVATSGDRLLPEDAEAALRERLLPLATIVTPNLAETEVLTGRRVADVGHAVDAARALATSSGVAVLVKGGHLAGERLVDVLVEPGHEPRRIEHVRHDIGPSHGTGCTLSAAITAGLAHGLDLATAVVRAVDFVQIGLEHAYPVGRGAVPVDHLAAGRGRRTS